MKKESIDTENEKEVKSNIPEPKVVKGSGTIHYPEYWMKRRNRLKGDFVKDLQKTADTLPEVEDAYGKYKRGVFLHRSYVVSVTRDANGLWGCHIYNSEDMPVSLQIVTEVRDRFIPDACVMAQLYHPRKDRTMKGVVLYQIGEDTKKEV